jgi:dTDP-4-amino-4,6-dideoxygalactose transaminase
MSDTTYVTQPFLPPLEELQPYLEQIWANRHLTNRGPFHEEFEQALGDHLGVEHVSLFANGTLALLAALHAVEISGEVITTPYSFVATAHALFWGGLKPVFVDIEPNTLNLDPDKIEAAISNDTAAILPVHVYGRPCDVNAIQSVADRHDLKVVYDAAHAFDVQDEGGSILRHGDVSILSFHATKVFTTFEGGAVISKDSEMKQRVDNFKNFGIADEVTVVASGINAKMNEFQAALGLLQLDYIDQAIQQRRKIDEIYREQLAGIRGIRCLAPSTARQHNYSYFPVLVDPDYPLSRDDLYARLREHNIIARRYFYPLISEFPMYRTVAGASRSNLPVASAVAEKVLCLPIYPDMEKERLARVIDVIQSRA